MYLPTRTVSIEAPVEVAADPGPAPPPADASAAAAPAPAVHRGWRGLDRNVYLLGTTSLITDISAEMVAVVLPIYLTTVFGFTPFQLGAFDGAYTAVAAVVCIAAALVADRRQRHKWVAAAGYALSAVCKLVLVVVAGRWIPTMATIYLDRLGKGIRTAPRDAILSLSSSPGRLAESFGVHRAMDTAGAVIGPFIAAIMLARDPLGFDAIFLTSFFISLLGFGVLVLLVDDRRPTGDGTSTGRAPHDPPSVSRAERPHQHRRRPLTRSLLAELWSDPRYRSLTVASVLLAVVTPGDALVFLAYQRQADLGIAAFPLLVVGASLIFLAAAVPIGRLADRIGRRAVFLAGQAAFVAVFVLLALGATGPVAVSLFLALIGIHLAATDGVLMSMVSATVPRPLRTTGLAVLVTANAGAGLVASLAFGALWSLAGVPPAALVFAVGLSVAVVGSGRVLREPVGAPS